MLEVLSFVTSKETTKLRNINLFFAEQTEQIKNPTAYMLTILYNAPEQFNLDLQNQMQYNMNTQIKDYSELERQLLGQVVYK